MCIDPFRACTNYYYDTNTNKSVHPFANGLQINVRVVAVYVRLPRGSLIAQSLYVLFDINNVAITNVRDTARSRGTSRYPFVRYNTKKKRSILGRGVEDI